MLDAQLQARSGALIVYLFRFTRGAMQYGFTSCGFDIVYGGLIYRSDQTVEFPGIKFEAQTGGSTNMELVVPTTHVIAQLYRTFFPSVPVRVEILMGVYNDPDQEYKTIWVGAVLSCSYSESAERKTRSAKLVCEHRMKQLDRQGLPYKFGSLCQHSVYRAGCDLDLEANGFTVTVEEIDGNEISVSGISGMAGQFLSGLFRFGDGEWRDIVAQSGSVLTLLFSIDGMQVGSEVRVYRGCDRSLNRCIALGNQNKILRFNIPNQNVFETGL